MSRKGILFVMTGASGVGKDTIRCAALPKFGNLFFSISATTREQRSGEVDGEHYFFLTKPVFEAMIADNRLLEFAEYVGDFYGTPQDPVDEALEQGRDVLLELELVGARKVKARRPEAVMIFIVPPSLSELERRLRGRNTDSEAKVQKRLSRAREEITAVREFDYVIINDLLTEAVAVFQSVIRAERAMAEHLTDRDIAGFLREM